MATALDESTRASIIAQAKQRAAASGKTAEQELYNYAQTQGIDNDGIDTMMGLQGGATQNWMNSTQKAAPQGNSMGSGMVAQPPGAAPNTSPNLWGPTPTEDERGSIIAQANDRAIKSGGNVTGEMVKYADSIGMPLDVAEQRMGYAAGTLSGGQKPATNGAKPAGMIYGQTALPPPGSGQTYVPELNRQVAQGTETIEGRIGGLMGTDGQGNYTNQVIRQAYDRAMQGFAKRGLLNSSMAQQAGQEAVIAKAIEIAGPDARTYFEQSRANQDARNQFGRDEAQQGYTVVNKKIDQANTVTNKGIDQANRVTNTGIDQTNTATNKAADQTNAVTNAGITQTNRATNTATDQANVLQRDRESRDFTMRQDYQRAQAAISTNFQRQVDTINASNASPEDKNVAIAQAQSFRDGEAVYTNNIYSRMPSWQSEWLSTATGSNDDSIDQATSMSYLQNVLNDPAQSQASRDKARARIQTLSAASTEAASTAALTAATSIPTVRPQEPVTYERGGDR